MKRFKKVISVMLVATMVLSLAACGKTDDKKDTAKKGPIENMTNCIASEPETIDPSINSSLDGATYILHLFEGLMKFEPTEDGESKVVEGQAKKVDISDDKLTYTFHLRDGIKWSDGKAVTANDFEYAWKRLVDPKTASDYQAFLSCLENAADIVAGKKDISELGVKAKDEKTLEVKLVAPADYFLSMTAGAQLVPLRKDLVEGNAEWTFTPETLVSNGPFTLKEWIHDDAIVMSKNKEYYDTKNVTVNEITWKLMADQNAMLAGFKGGTLDMINDVPVDEVKTLLDDGTLITLPQLGTYAVVFNTEKKPFNDPKVREALSLAIDRNYICEKVVQTGVEPASAWVPSGINSLDKDGKASDFREAGGDYYAITDDKYEANVKKAKQLLADAGYPDGKGFPVVTYLYNTSDAHQKIFEALENMWSEKLGITVTGSNQDWNVFLTTREDGDFEVCRHGWVADFDDAINFLDMWTTSSIDGNNYARWSNKEYDKLIEKSITETDTENRTKILHQAEDILMNDNAIAPLYFYRDRQCLSKEIGGLFHSSLGYFFFKYCYKK